MRTWQGPSKLFLIAKNYIRTFLHYFFWKKKILLNFSYIPNATEVFKLIYQIKKETDMVLRDTEAYQIYKAVRKTEKIQGEVAEVGVFRGASARLIVEATKKPIHLFDTFEGLPELSKKDNPEQFQKGNGFDIFENTQNYLKKYSNIHLYKGLFPSTSEPIKDKEFSFVYLDVDLSEPSLIL